MRIFTLVTLACFTFITGIYSQDRAIRDARLLIAAGRNIEAIETLHPVLLNKNVPDEAFLLLGAAYLSIPGSNESALKYLGEAVKRYPLERRPPVEALEARFMLGQALHLDYQFEAALSLYDELLRATPVSMSALISDIEQQRQYSLNAIELIKDPVNYEIQPLGPAINTLHQEHSPVVTLDESTIFFTSNRPVPGMAGDIAGFFENIHVSYWRDGAWTAAEVLDLPGNFMGNRATVSVSPDGQQLIFFQSDGRHGDLYITRFRFGAWSAPEPLPPPVTSDFNETHATLSLDGNSIWFTSDRPGGLGGTDIYISHLLPNGQWGEPINAGPTINTSLNEESPYIHPGGTTLYFSSEGHNSMGGYDIFRVNFDENGNPGRAINLGYPINTPGDDLFYIPSPDGHRVYFASTRQEGVGLTDIFLKSFPADDERSLAVMACHIFGENEKPLPDAIARLYHLPSNQQAGIFRPNRATGKLVAVLAPGQEYRIEIEAKGYATRVVKFKIPPRDAFSARQRAFYLPPVILDKK